MGDNNELKHILQAIVGAVAGWSGVTTIALLVSTASMQAEIRALQVRTEASEVRTVRLEDKIFAELQLIRESVEALRGQK